MSFLVVQETDRTSGFITDSRTCHWFMFKK